ncbi:MAG: site-2 protease family protein [Mycobacteriales bacterium]
MTDQADPQPSRRVADGVRVGRAFGVPVYVAPSWFLVAALITYFFAPTVEQRVAGIGSARYLVSLLFALLLYLSVFIHELSHTLTARRLGLPVRRITLQLLGGVSEIEREPDSPGKEYLVAIAGPLISLLLAGVGFALVGQFHEGGITRVLAGELALSNGLVAAFNLLPGLPLDGGRVLRAAVWGLSGRPDAGTVVAAWVGRGVAVVLLAVPLVSSAGTGSPANLVNVIYFALLASFIWGGATAALRSAQVQRRLPELRLRTLARRALPVSADLPLAEALRRAADSGARGLVVVDGAGRPQAVVSEAAVAATPEIRRPWVSVGTLARQLAPGLVLDADLSGAAVLEAMRRAPASEYLVVESSGDVYGVLTSTDVTSTVNAAG